MPALTKDHLAMQLQQNWLAAHAQVEKLASGKETLDDSLTSLNWLQNLNMSLGAGAAPVSPPTMRHEAYPREAMKVNPNQVLGTDYSYHQRYTDVIPDGMGMISPYHLTYDRIDYKTNPYIKPPYSYAALICMAMKSSQKSKMTLSSIYNWITDNFMYYRMADPSWQVCLARYQ